MNKFVIGLGLAAGAGAITATATKGLADRLEPEKGPTNDEAVVRTLLVASPALATTLAVLGTACYADGIMEYMIRRII